MTRRLSLTVEGRNLTVELHKGDLGEHVRFTGPIAVDSEAMGLDFHRDRLCLVQLFDGVDGAHLVQIEPGRPAPRLQALLSDSQRLKILHFARFDVAMVQRHLGVLMAPVYCTKIASRLARTYTDRHGLKDVVKELLGRDLAKEQQSSDWGAAELSDAQLVYAANDVLHLHEVREKLDAMLDREGRRALAEAAFAFLPTRALLDLAGWPETDIFAHG
jgi:ribonuclease D